MSNTLQSIFQKSSKTYFYSSLFFPANVRESVFILYAFVRIVDNFVDDIPQQKDAFYHFKKAFDTLRKNPQDKILQTLNPQEQEVLTKYLILEQTYQFDPAWMDAFFESMEMDLTKKVYHTIKETEHYIYGSAEVIGLFMAKILDLPLESYPFAQKLGSSMQYINFIRDINEDITELGRSYLPLDQLQLCGLKNLTKEEATKHPEEFKKFIIIQLDQWRKWQAEAEKGFPFIPKTLRIPIKTASDMYMWTAQQIAENPMTVFEKKVKPTKWQVMWQATKNTLLLPKI